MLRYHTIPVTPFQQNCSLVWCDETNEAALIDPGGEVERLKAAGMELVITVDCAERPCLTPRAIRVLE